MQNGGGRPGEHTLVMGGSAAERGEVLDRIEAGLRDRSTGAAPRIGRIGRQAGDAAARDAAEMWNDVADAARLNAAENLHTSGFGKIQNAAGNGLFVAIIDDLDAMLGGWSDPGEALNLRWALQNVNGLMVVAGTEDAAGDESPHEHSILRMTFATQSLQT
ncbi:MAG: hypothetical protein OXG72_21090 [Acidobacteria bacterium]|nr:hypothetical protein [Acidobacteriota bacterium]